MQNTVVTDSPLIPGKRVSGTTTIAKHADRIWRTTTWSGIYVGQKASDWSGEMMHEFRNGEIRGIRQGSFAIPVSQFAPAEQTR